MTSSDGPKIFTELFGGSVPFSRVDLAMMNGRENVIIIEGDKAYSFLRREDGQSFTLTLESPTPRLLSEANFPSGVQASLQSSRDIEAKQINLMRDLEIYLYHFENKTISQVVSIAIP